MTCPCGSGKSLAACCGRFLDGSDAAHTPEQLMRSRYTAHVLLGRGKREYGEYLVCTWLAAAELGLSADSFAEHVVNWQKLEILHSSERGDSGTVEFKAYFYPPGPVLKPELQVHHERSRFKRVNGVWFYVEAMAIPGNLP